RPFPRPRPGRSPWIRWVVAFQRPIALAPRLDATHHPSSPPGLDQELRAVLGGPGQPQTQASIPRPDHEVRLGEVRPKALISALAAGEHVLGEDPNASDDQDQGYVRHP